MGLGTAFKAFFASIGNNETASKIEQILRGETLGPEPGESSGRAKLEAPTAPGSPDPVPPVAPARDSAVTLLAALQRESRLVDLIHEDLASYSDAQVGAAARPCLQQCREVLERLMAVKPLTDAAEGDAISVPDDASPQAFQWIGESSAAPGKLVHHGWKATQVDLPTWSGDAKDADVIAPAQVQA